MRFPAHHGLLAAILLAAAPGAFAAGAFLDLRATAPIHGDAVAGHAKATVCMACHGAAGIAAVPTFPNLAGQKADYLYWQLVEFKRDARADSPMTAQVATLDDADMRNLSAYFAELKPVAAISAADRASTDRGVKLFRDGNPAQGIPPCQGCHGVNGAGDVQAAQGGPYRTFPALRGQHAAYVMQRLKDFRDGKSHASSNDEIMTGVARTLDDDTIHALADGIEAMPH